MPTNPARSARKFHYNQNYRISQADISRVVYSKCTIMEAKSRVDELGGRNILIQVSPARGASARRITSEKDALLAHSLGVD